MYSLSGRYARGLWCIGIIGTLVADWGCAPRHSSAAEATQPVDAPKSAARLTVRPKAMATGTETIHAGIQRLDSLYGGDSLLDMTYIYVPKRCVGKQRAPLLVLLHGDHMTGLKMLNESEGLLQTLADSNGIILLAPTSHSDDKGWGDMHITQPPNVDVPRIDAAIRQVLRHYAIDPERVALLGESAGAGGAMDLGYVNGDVFNGTIVFSAFAPFLGEHEFDVLTQHGTPKFFIEMNVGEAVGLQMPTFVSWMQRRGYSVTSVQDAGPHRVYKERGVAGFAWLTKNWH
jgi:poly(3-hydroxybutyrate) depolymerase